MCWRYEASRAFCSALSCILYMYVHYSMYCFILNVTGTKCKLDPALQFLTQDARGGGVTIFSCLWWGARIRKTYDDREIV